MKAVVCTLYNLVKKNSISELFLEIFQSFTNTFDNFCEKFNFLVALQLEDCEPKTVVNNRKLLEISKRDDFRDITMHVTDFSTEL